MLTRPLGNTSLRVSVLGLGCGPLGDARMSDADADRLVRGALDLGITLFDAARSYGAAEERLGRALEGQDDVVISTKGGYGIDGVAEWTPACITRGVDEARRRLRRPRVDIFHLHSCPSEVTDQVADALASCVADGAVAVAGYAGDGAALAHAVASERFSVVECSLNPVDRENRAVLSTHPSGHQLGVIAKRPLMNACFRHAEKPEAHDVGTYWRRAQTLGLAGIAADAGLSPSALCIRFSAFAPGVSSILVGTSRLEHLASAVCALEDGPLPADVLARLDAAYDPAWPALV